MKLLSGQLGPVAGSWTAYDAQLLTLIGWEVGVRAHLVETVVSVATRQVYKVFPQLVGELGQEGQLSVQV